MSQQRAYVSDIAFTPAVKAMQSARGSRAAYAHMEDGGGWRTEIDDDLAAFIGAQTSVFLATANAEGQPYIQHRGGPPGFLHVLDAKTLAFADDPALLAALRPKDYKAVPEQAILFKVAAWDANCPQHIPQRFEAADVAAALADRDRRIEELQAEIARLRGESEGSRRGQ